MASMAHGLLLLAVVCIGACRLVNADAAQACAPTGEQLSAASGTILIPENTTTPEQWSSVRCQWTITVAEGKFIDVKYLWFNLSAPCNNHYLKLYQGSDFQQVYQTNLCLAADNKDFVTTSNVLKIEYFYNSSYPENEFRRVEIRWNTTDSNSTKTSSYNSTSNNIPRACYEEVWLNETSGDILIPENITSPIPTYVYCQWLIEVPADKVVSITFPEFDLSNNTACGNTYMEFFLDYYSESVFKGSLCKDRRPRNFTATTNKLKITFSSHSYSSYQDQNIGSIKVHWEAVDPQDFSTTLPTGFQCGYTTTNKTGGFCSPNMPYNYPNDIACLWTIKAKDKEIVAIHFENFELEPIYDCRWDYIEVVTSQNSTKFCSNAVQYQSKYFEGETKVYFVSDAIVTAPAFQLKYDIYDESYKACAGGITLTNDSGTFSSISLSHKQSGLHLCEWKVLIDSSKFVSVVFDNFNVSCSGEFYVVDGNTNNNLFDSNLCGRNTIKPFIARTNSVIFRQYWYNYGTPGIFQISWNSTAPVNTSQPTNYNCTNYLTAKNGIISSPGFPSNYSNNFNCRWEIEKGKQESIRIYYLWHDIEKGPGCSFDYLQLDYNNNYSSPQTTCGSQYYDYEYSLYFSEANPKINFHSDTSVSGRGFVLAWAASDYNGTLADMSCGMSSLADPFGFLHSPGFPSSYPKNSDCQWTITAPLNQVVVVGFISVLLPNQYDSSVSGQVCTQGTYLEFSDQNMTTVKRLCSRPSSNDLTSPTNVLSIRFKSDNESYHMGFLIYWNFTVAPTTSGNCGGTLTNRSGVITSPSYPNSYPPNTNCQWTIHAQPGQGLYLSSGHLSLEASANCTADYVMIRQGNETVGKKYCSYDYFSGDYFGTVIISFHSDAFFESSGFQIYWYSTSGPGPSSTTSSNQQANCPVGQTFNNSSGSFLIGGNVNLSPGYSMYCSWTIVVDPTKVVMIGYTKFNLTGSCSYTYLSVTQDQMNAVQVYKDFLCNTTMGRNFTSTSNSVTFSFYHYATSEYQHPGSVEVVWSTAEPTNMTSSEPVTNYNCGYVATNSSGNITSPGYPAIYGNDLDCKWKIPVSAGQIVILKFADFDVEGHFNCIWDYVNISIAHNWTVHCGRQYISQVNFAGDVDVYFHSDHIVGRKGFNMPYQIVDSSFKACAGGILLNSTSGYFTNLTFPTSNFSTYYQCMWTVQVEPGMIINITFVEFEIHCNGGSFSVFEGNTSTNVFNSYFCGGHKPRSFVSSSNTLRFEYYYQTYGESGTFNVSWQSIAPQNSTTLPLSYNCGSNINGNKGFIYSPGYPDNYTTNLDCLWTIENPTNVNIRLSLLKINFEEVSGCTFDYLYVNGNTSNGQLGKRICRWDYFDDNYYTSDVKIVFHSDEVGADPGFIISWVKLDTNGEPIDTSCYSSESLTSSFGLLTSPKFPFSSPTNATCDWQLAALSGKVIELTLIRIRLSYDCQGGDYLGVQYGKYGEKKICNDYYNQVLTIPNNTASIKFVTDGYNDYEEAVVLWRFQDTNSTALYPSCGGTVTGKGGNITSPNYPSRYAPNLDCYWHIEPPEVKMVGIYVMQSDIESNMNCNADYLAFQEPGYNNSRKLCGYSTTNFKTSNLTIHFHSDQLVAGQGFILSWNFTDSVSSNSTANSTISPTISSNWTSVATTTVGVANASMETTGPTANCPAGQTFNNSSGIFLIGGNFNLSLGYSMQCSWTIVVDPTKVVMIGYTKFNLTGSCSYTYLSVTQDQMNAVQVYKDFLCNTTTGRNFTSTSNSVTFSFYHYSNSEYQHPGTVEVVWSTAEPTNMTSSEPVTNYNCGYVATNSSGNITSPGYPAIYGNDLDCKWKIPVADGQIVILKFADFDVEGHFDCIWDYVNISIAHNWTVHCGRQYISQVNFAGDVDVYFHSDHIVGRKGFNMPYQIVDSSFKACAGGILLNSTSGYFTNLTFPTSNFSTYYQCMWTVQVEPGMVIDISFVEFEVPCNAGSFSVFEGNTGTNVFNSYFCGGQKPRSFVSSSNALRFEYYYQTYGESGTFNVSWQSVAPQNSTTLPLSYNCGSNINGNKGFIYSPGYPDNYTTSLDCLWTIENPTNANIRLSLLKINLEEVSGCTFDYLYVNGNTSNGQLEKKICRWDYFDNYYTSDVKIVFHSDEVGADPGFIISWVKLDTNGEPIDTSCYSSESLASSFGLLTSPKFPFSSPTNATCEWQLTALSGKVIELTLIRIRLSYDCQGGDYLGVQYGKYGEKRVCNDYYNQVLTIPNNTATIKLVTDGYNDYEEAVVLWRFQDTNFTALYPSCGGTVTGKGGNITSPNYPSRYAPNLDCYWHIVPPEGKMVGIYVMQSDIESNMNCNADFLAFQEPGYNNTRKLCGYSTTNFKTSNLTIHFHSDQLVAGQGFILSWNFTDSVSSNSTANSTISPTISSNWTSVATTTVGVANASMETTGPTGATAITTVASNASISTGPTSMTISMSSANPISTTEPTALLNATTSSMTNTGSTTLATAASSSATATAITSSGSMANTGPSTLATVTTSTGSMTNTESTTLATATSSSSMATAITSTDPMTNTSTTVMSNAAASTVGTVTNATAFTGATSSKGTDATANAPTSAATAPATGVTTTATTTASTPTTSSGKSSVTSQPHNLKMIVALIAAFYQLLL